MRILVLFFIFINIGFYYWIDRPELSQSAESLGKKVQTYATIQTLSERDNPAGQLPPSSVGQGIKPITRKPECASLGPFESVDALTKIYDRLVNVGVNATQNTIQQRVPKSYWVYLEPHVSLNSAKETVAYLEEKNIKEHFIMRAPEEQKFSISLGLYSELGPANELMKKIGEIELDPQLDIRFDDITEYWIHYLVSGESGEVEQLKVILQQNEKLLVRKSDC